MTQVQRIIHHLCNPNETTEYGQGPTYKKFIVYVKNFIQPYMAMQFEEEAYYKDVYDEIWQNQHTVQQLPRGHSKTEMVGIWLTIYLADYMPHNPFYKRYKGRDKRVQEQLLIAGGQADLDAWSERIKDFFYKSPPLIRLKPAGARKDQKGSAKWNSKEMALRNGAIIHLRTVKSKIRGLHVDRVCADDLITESSSLTDKQTIDVWDGAVDGTTTAKEAMVNVIGTPLRFTDIQFHLKNKPEGYYFKARPAIKDQDKKLVLSPKRRTYDDLMRTKARIGSTKFSAEYMLNPIDDSTSLIKRQHIESCLDKYLEGVWLKPNIKKMGNEIEVTLDRINSEAFKREQWEQVFITADFAFSDRTTADWSVFSYYGVRNGKRYRLGYVRGQGMSAMTQFHVLKALRDYLGADFVGVEENSIKGVLKDVKPLNLPLKLFWMGNQDKTPALKPDRDFVGKRWTISKINSIERLDTSYENQVFVIPYKTERDREKADLQIEETISWALDEGKLCEIGRHPDIPITDILLNEMIENSGSGFEMAVASAPGAGGEYDDDKPRTIRKTPGIAGRT